MTIPFVTITEVREALTAAGLGGDAACEAGLAFVETCHGHQQRLGGAPVLEEHLYPVALDVLADSSGEPLAVRRTRFIAALCHDTVEDAGVLLGTLVQLFGRDVAEIVDLLSDCEQPGSRKKPPDAYWSAIARREDVSRIKLRDRKRNLETAHKIANRRILLEFCAETEERIYPLVRQYAPEMLDGIVAAVEALRSLAAGA